MPRPSFLREMGGRPVGRDGKDIFPVVSDFRFQGEGWRFVEAGWCKVLGGHTPLVTAGEISSPTPPPPPTSCENRNHNAQCRPPNAHLSTCRLSPLYWTSCLSLSLSLSLPPPSLFPAPLTPAQSRPGQNQDQSGALHVGGSTGMHLDPRAAGPPPFAASLCLSPAALGWAGIGRAREQKTHDAARRGLSGRCQTLPRRCPDAARTPEAIFLFGPSAVDPVERRPLQRSLDSPLGSHAHAHDAVLLAPTITHIPIYLLIYSSDLPHLSTAATQLDLPLCEHARPSLCASPSRFPFLRTSPLVDRIPPPAAHRNHRNHRNATTTTTANSAPEVRTLHVRHHLLLLLLLPLLSLPTSDGPARDRFCRNIFWVGDSPVVSHPPSIHILHPTSDPSVVGSLLLLLLLLLLPPAFTMMGIYAVANAQKYSRDMDERKAAPLSTASFEAAIEGPPSPERIRAYTEQMKRSSMFGTPTFSSATSSFRSHASSSGSDTLSLSRKSSGRSTASNIMAKGDRPESIHIFGKTIFSRTSRKSRRDPGRLSTSTSPLTMGAGSDGKASGSSSSSTSRHNAEPYRPPISYPFNFQHVTHTRQDHLPGLMQSNAMELVTEFSAIRASQAPLCGGLKGIRAEDLHFENFSSETLLPQPESAERPKSSPRYQQTDSGSPVPPRRVSPPLSHARSHDNLRTVRPARPPRSPQSPPCPMPLPARTSSRTASILFDKFDPFATTTLSRPHSKGGFRRPAPFSPPLPMPQRQSEQEIVADARSTPSTTPQGEEGWPLTAPGNFGADLADVPEEEENRPSSRRSKRSTVSGELRLSQSVPLLRTKSMGHSLERSSMETATTLGRSPPKSSSQPISPLVFADNSWEDDIDYCYEHEAEAHCDYQWDRLSEDGHRPPTPDTTMEPMLDINLEDEETAIYQGRFRSSLLVPSAYDLPELSPMSSISMTESDPRTPPHFLRPLHVRSPSGASSFKESHGFDLSPSLLIPSDFAAQMEQDVVFNTMDHHASSATLFAQEPYVPSISPMDDSSTASYRGSARSSSSTRISGTTSRTSQDSVHLAAKLLNNHHSISSTSSLPDLVHSNSRRSNNTAETSPDLATQISNFRTESPEGDDLEQEEPQTHIRSISGNLQQRRQRSFNFEQATLRKGVNHFAPSPISKPHLSVPENPMHAINIGCALSPVAESSIDSPRFQTQIHGEFDFKIGEREGFKPRAVMAGEGHGRKISAPVLSPSLREFPTRMRAASSAAQGLAGLEGKKRGSYMLFPQI
ncbi:hypothetical protein B7494_g4730 [Chlorociboria aeruginascens]|nr:hypothetical protein B7494_g4730 [Chlorociboria aeruginascens]